MKITKFGHNCLLIEEGSLRALTDPGSWNQTPDVENLDCILITHEHGDHLDIPQLQEVLSKNPAVRVISHESVGKILDETNIAYEQIRSGEEIKIREVSIKSFGTKHACFYGDMPKIQNTGYFIANRLFVTGDALHDVPDSQVEILALACGGPWMRMSEAIDYAKKLKPKFVIPVHDAMYIEKYRDNVVPRVVGENLKDAGIEFRDMKAGTTESF
ncbi:MAG: MBL fold metallo-hydrolase [Patescibacteria group bacterium]